jgi:hypothetical protein
MRNGTMLADDTLRGVLESTGALDPEQAFLTLVDRAAARQALGHRDGDSGVGGTSQARGGVPA